MTTVIMEGLLMGTIMRTTTIIHGSVYYQAWQPLLDHGCNHLSDERVDNAICKSKMDLHCPYSPWVHGQLRSATNG